MSDIYSFRIISIKGKELCVHAKIVHPDVDWVHDTKNFALQIIMEMYDHMKKGYIYNSAWQTFPFPKEKAARMVDSHPLKEQMDHWLELQYGPFLEITEEEYKLISSGKVDKENPRYQNISSYGFSDGYWHISYSPRYKAFMKVAELAIMEVEMSNEQHMPRKHNQIPWEQRKLITDEEWEEMYKDKPSCDLRITALNEQLLHHMRAGSYWHSTMYDYTYYAK
jgi:hypothetical protein